ALKFYRARNFHKLDAAIFLAKKIAIEEELLPPRRLKTGARVEKPAVTKRKTTKPPPGPGRNNPKKGSLKPPPLPIIEGAPAAPKGGKARRGEGGRPATDREPTAHKQRKEQGLSGSGEPL